MPRSNAGERHAVPGGTNIKLELHALLKVMQDVRAMICQSVFLPALEDEGSVGAAKTEAV